MRYQVSIIVSNILGRATYRILGCPLFIHPSQNLIILSIVILGGLLLKLLVREIFFSRLLSSSVSHSSLEQFE